MQLNHDSIFSVEDESNLGEALRLKNAALRDAFLPKTGETDNVKKPDGLVEEQASLDKAVNLMLSRPLNPTDVVFPEAEKFAHVSSSEEEEEEEPAQFTKIENSGMFGQFVPESKGEQKPDLNYDTEMLDPSKNFTQEQLREAIASAQAKKKQQMEEDLKKDHVIYLHSKSVIAPPKFILGGVGSCETRYFNYLDKIVEDAKVNPPLMQPGQVIKLSVKQVHDQRVMLLLTQIAKDIKRYKSLTIENSGPSVHRKLNIARVVRMVVEKHMDYLNPAAGYYAEAAKEA